MSKIRGCSAVSSEPQQVGLVDLPGATGIFVADSYAYVIAGNHGLHVIDISTPSKPHEVGHYYEPYMMTVSAPVGYRDVYVSGSYAYVAAGKYGLRVIDVSTPSSPQEIGYYDTPDFFANGVYVANFHAYIADGYGLRIVDVSEPSRPKEIGFCDTPNSTRGVYVSDSYAYVTSSDNGNGGIRIIDVSIPAKPKLVGYYDKLSYINNVYVSGFYVYVAEHFRGLQIYEFIPQN